MMENENKVLNIIKELSNSRSEQVVFEDVLKIVGYSMINTVTFKRDREKAFFEVVNKYNLKEQDQLTYLMSILVNSYSQDKNCDILANIYQKLGLNNKSTSQFFTPPHVADLMSKIALTKEEALNEIKDKGFITISDPSCGSGRLLISSYNQLLDYGVSRDKILLIGNDIDVNCCLMTYIALSLKGANLIINHADTLNNKVYDTYYSSYFILNEKLQENLSSNRDISKKSREEREER